MTTSVEVGKRDAGDRAPWRRPLILLLVVGLALATWSVVVALVVPIPLETDQALGGETATRLLRPWYRFDAGRHVRLARDGYDLVNSVTPPLYPLLVRPVGVLLAATPLPQTTGYLFAAFFVSWASLGAALFLFCQLTRQELGASTARRAPVYFLLFPTAFFLYAPYAESLFLLLTIGSFWAMRQDKIVLAGGLGFLAALTRLNGAVLILPVAYTYARRRDFNWRRFDARALALLLPPAGLLLFLAWRRLVGFPPLATVYYDHWFQTGGIPGSDLYYAVRILVTGEGQRLVYTLVLDLLGLLFVAAMTIPVYRRLGPTYALYMVGMLVFILFSVSPIKPLHSFSRYVLVFFPVFMVLPEIIDRPWRNRLWLYPSVLLYLWLSGQFLIGGWVA